MLTRILLVLSEKELLKDPGINKLFDVIISSIIVEEVKICFLENGFSYQDLKKIINLFNPQIIAFLTPLAYRFAIPVNTDYPDIKVVNFKSKPEKGEIVNIYGSWFNSFFIDEKDKDKILVAFLEEPVIHR